VIVIEGGSKRARQRFVFNLLCGNPPPDLESSLRIWRQPALISGRTKFGTAATPSAFGPPAVSASLAVALTWPCVCV
jgi:hypothetical protein